MKSLIKKVLVDFVAGKPIKGSVKKIINQRRDLIKKGIVGLAITGSITAGGYFLADYSKEWINDKIKESLTQYEQNDKQWTKGKIEELLRNYEQNDKQWTKGKIEELLRNYEQNDKQWTRKNFEARVPLEQLARAFNNTYKVVNKSFYETREGEIIKGYGGSGSGILLKGGYLLTCKHVIDEGFPRSFSHPYWGLVKYHHNELSIESQKGKVELERMVLGERLDYALLKLKDNEDLLFYSQGLNLPSNVEPGMRSVAIGFSLGIKNIRLGNVSQIESDAGGNYFTFKNSIIFGDSGGPLFVIEEGDIKLVAISAMLTMMRDWNVPEVRHPTNLGYGLKLEAILRDIEEQLDFGYLDDETISEVENFLELNGYFRINNF